VTTNRYITLGVKWLFERSAPYQALGFQSQYVHSGKKAAMLVLQPGDQIDEEKGTILERAELKESKKLSALENSTYEYSFFILLPHDFPIVPTRLVPRTQDARMLHPDVVVRAEAPH